MFRKVLIANRGEIAVRVIRTCREMGIRTVAVYSEPDRGAKHVRLADEARLIGPAPAEESYLNANRILAAAAESRADALHPGYGFLSENADFAESCAAAGIKFVGPSADAIRAMGVKTHARKIMEKAGVPVVPGTPATGGDPAQAASWAREIGYPVMVKAAAGGGGKGMRLVEDPEHLAEALDRASGEAKQAFGDDTVYLEKAILRPRHVEVQILADEAGAVMQLGERECSLQRRHQKILEETPSPLVAANPGVRQDLFRAAVAAAKAVRYANAGTVEFLMDPDCRFYFLEMNTRLQVEHPVTELVAGVDLVREQLLVAAGQPLRKELQAARPRGHAIECRVYAEDPATDFMPSPGRIDRLVWPSGPGIRVDAGADPGWTVPVNYDPLIAKMCAWAPTRPEAIARLRLALQETVLDGIATTLELFGGILKNPRFLAGDFDTGFLAREFGDWPAGATPSEEARLAAALAALQAERTVQAAEPGPAVSRWKAAGRAAALARRGGRP